MDALPDMLAGLKLTALRDRLDGSLDEAARGAGRLLRRWEIGSNSRRRSG